ncbi:hypothetical protein FEM03_11305 [Phragmitibacter flavus]|uniref:Uncharacterized protein n=1 Tax=Phragmitibacter flavus TaxID=2576071 RepID=A0A5R8KFZ3_9BACT|nr:hypothetical protein [Phragmitibacter flavus]TLD70885.1 hypothetical protein FEM03_11305 [Phragmitibacter flavus]
MPLTTEQKQSLATLLRERLTIISNHEWRDRDPETHLSALKEISIQIENCSSEWRADLPGQMRHYLANASYQKALAWLEETHSSSQVQ